MSKLELQDNQMIKQLLRLKEDLIFLKSGLLIGDKEREINITDLGLDRFEKIEYVVSEYVNIALLKSLSQQILELNKYDSFPAFLYAVNSLFGRLLKDYHEIKIPGDILSESEIATQEEKHTAVIGEFDPDSPNKIIIDGCDKYSQIMIQTLNGLLKNKLEIHHKPDLRTVDLFIVLLRMDVVCSEKTLNSFEKLIIQHNDCSTELLPLGTFSLGMNRDFIIRQKENIYPEKNTEPKPIIFIGIEDVTSFDFETSLSTIAVYYRDNLDRKIKFIDSSIWHRYVPVSINSFSYQNSIDYGKLICQMNLSRYTCKGTSLSELIPSNMSILRNVQNDTFYSNEIKADATFVLIDLERNTIVKNGSVTIKKIFNPEIEISFSGNDGYSFKFSVKSEIRKGILFTGTPVEFSGHIHFRFDSTTHQIDIESSQLEFYKQVDFYSILYDTINDFYSSYELYSTVPAREYLEFQIRILLNDHVVNIEQDHMKELLPFSFHSERMMAVAFNNLKREIQREYQSSLRWKILLIDDFADSYLRTEKGTIELKMRKRISNLLNFDMAKLSNDEKSMNNPCDNSWVCIVPVSVTNQNSESLINKAIEILSENQFDIIILDYLLAKVGEKREYGYELFKKLSRDNKTLMAKKGPFGKFWIFPMSNISTAIMDNLREQSIDNLSESWHISCGGDPVNTPYFFCNNMINFMQQQINYARVSIKEILDFLDTHLAFDKIEESDYYNQIPKWAAGLSGYFIYSFGAHEMLYNDSVSSGEMPSFSKAMYDYISKQRYDFESGHNFYEHVRLLLHALAFGSSALWEEASEELDFLEDVVTNEINLKGKNYEKISKGIGILRKYILEIRKGR